MDGTVLKRTPLHGWHQAHGGRMVAFGGWEMPVQYAAGPREEHLRVRSAAGLFDTSHMGRLRIGGPGALAFLQRVQSWDASRIGHGRAHYAMLLNEAGGIIDDIFLYRTDGRAREEWLVVVNASNRDRDWWHLQEQARGFDVRLEDASLASGMIALQGPAALGILARVLDAGGEAAAGLGYHRVAEARLAGVAVQVCTTGYTGEPGCEIVVPAEACERVWTRLAEAGSSDGLVACGLAARDSLRAEAGLPLYGHELDERTDPISAGYDRAAVSLDGHDFIGRQALLALRDRGPAERIVGFVMTEPGVPRQGYPVHAGGRRVGEVTTGLASPSTGRFLGMARIETAHATMGADLGIVIRDVEKAARIVERPFYRSPHWR